MSWETSWDQSPLEMLPKLTGLGRGMRVTPSQHLSSQTRLPLGTITLQRRMSSEAVASFPGAAPPQVLWRGCPGPVLSTAPPLCLGPWLGSQQACDTKHANSLFSPRLRKIQKMRPHVFAPGPQTRRNSAASLPAGVCLVCGAGFFPHPGSFVLW